jgi:hypothetical protein
MGNCVRRETGFDYDDQNKQEDLNTQELMNKVLSMKNVWKNRGEKSDVHRSAILTRNNIITEIDLSDLEEKTAGTKESVTSKKSERRKSALGKKEFSISKKFEEDEEEHDEVLNIRT